MAGFGRIGLVAAAVCALAGGQVQAAGTTCWMPDEVAAAKMRDLQTLLMVAALRCHGGGVDVLGDYNRFVAINRSELVAANARIKAHFDRSEGGVAGQRGYDRFTTALANIHGAGQRAGACADMAALAQSGAGAGGGLMPLAEQSALDPMLPGGRCPAEYAAVTPAAR